MDPATEPGFPPGEESHRRGHRLVGAVGVGLLLGVYVLLYLRVSSYIGSSAGTYYLVPLLAAAWFFGWRGGLAVALLGVPLQLSLAHFSGTPFNPAGEILRGGAAILFGWLRDAFDELQQDRERERRSLEEAGWLRSTIEADARRRSEQQQILVDLSRKALQGEEPRLLMQRAVECAARGLGTDFGDLLEYDEATQRFVFRGIVGTTEDLLGRPIDAGRGSHSGYTLLVGQPVVVEDYSTDARFHMPIPTRRHRIVSGLSAIVGDPMGRPFGVMAVYTKAKRRFSDDDLAYLQSLANIVALALGPRAPARDAPALDVRW